MDGPPGQAGLAAAHHRPDWRADLVLGLATAVILGPFLLTVFASLQTNDEFVTSNSIIPSKWTLASYVSVFTEIPMARMAFNGIFIAVLATVGNLAASTVAAFCLAKLRFPGEACCSASPS